jgi:hypothetical protein
MQMICIYQLTTSTKTCLGRTELSLFTWKKTGSVSVYVEALTSFERESLGCLVEKSILGVLIRGLMRWLENILLSRC